MKRFLALCAAAVLLATAAPSVSAAAYIGNVNSQIFHYENCRFGGKRIKEVNRVYLTRGTRRSPPDTARARYASRDISKIKRLTAYWRMR